MDAFSHVGIMCNDPLKIEEFYTKHFGFKRARVYAPGPEQVVMIKSGEIYLELFKATKERPIPQERGQVQNMPVGDIFVFRSKI